MASLHQKVTVSDPYFETNFKNVRKPNRISQLDDVSMRKLNHKKGSFSTLTYIEQLKKININSSGEIKLSEFKKNLPKFLLNKTTLQKYDNKSQSQCPNYQNQSQKLKNDQQLNYTFKKYQQIPQKLFFGKNIRQNNCPASSMTNREKTKQNKFDINRIYQIKEKMKKIRDQLTFSNFNNIQNQGYNTQVKNLKNQNLKNQNLKNQNNNKNFKENFQQKKELPCFVSNFQKLSLKIQDFQCLKRLGSGIYGEVSLYRHFQTNFILAIKKISKKSFDSADQSIYLGRQIKIHSFADHPNIVQMYGFFEDLQNIYLMMEACNEGNLFSILQKNGGNLPEDKVKRYVRNVSKALEYLHNQNIIHRDIKPENILVSNGIAKLCDFGWSINTLEKRTTLCGTPLYSSPQIVKSQKYDRKVDIWCVGVLTYELIYGRTPFQIQSKKDLQKVIDCEIYFPFYINVSEECKDFIRGCLEKDSFERYEIQDVVCHPFLKDEEKIRDSLKASYEKEQKCSEQA